MYLHCDSHANARLRNVMDEIFQNKDSFKNEIIWQRTTAHSNPRKSYGRLHDVILFYTKSEDYAWNQQYVPYSDEHLENSYRFTEQKTGRRFASRDLTASVYHASKGQIYEWKGKKPPASRVWAYAKEEMQRLEKEGRIVYSKSGYPRLKLYLDEAKGVALQDIWTDIRPVQAQANERLGYPTQKPEALLERIVKSSSDKGDILLDPFCGCGTALVVSERLGRSWVGIDISPTACTLMAQRLRRLRVKAPIMGMPMAEADLKKLPPFEFQNWVVRRLFGRISARKSGDMGIDGYTFEGNPIQVKQSEGVGRNVVDNFETALRRASKDAGVIVALSFTKDAIEERARAENEEKLIIHLFTVKDLLRTDRDLPQPSYERKEEEGKQGRLL